MFLYITENMNPNYNIIPCFVEMKSKQQIKFVVLNYKIPTGPPTLPQKLCVFKSSLLPKTFPF